MLFRVNTVFKIVFRAAVVAARKVTPELLYIASLLERQRFPPLALCVREAHNNTEEPRKQ
jgi:hypothetical protein